MKRKDFLSAAALSFSSLSAFSKTSEGFETDARSIPPYLQPGDRIGIISAAGFISRENCAEAIRALQSWGYRVKIGDSVGKKDFSFGGTDEERAADLQQMLDDPDIRAIMIARGGYGIARIIDLLDFGKFQERPKWIIGFSDVTVLHAHINSNFRIATVHSKMCNSFVAPEAADPAQLNAINSLRPCLTGKQIVYRISANPANRTGQVEGILVGGNLKTIESLLGTKSQLKTRKAILFLEDTGEYLYSIDRMLKHLYRTTMLHDIAALIIGGFKVKPDDAGEEFGRTLEEIVLEHTKYYHYPVCFDFPVGHQKDNRALRCGVPHILSVLPDSVTLQSLS